MWDGTSMATPFVAGQAALVHSASVSAGGSRSVNPGCVAERITGTARPLDAANPGHEGMLGDGHADAGASVTAAQASPCRGGGDDD